MIFLATYYGEYGASLSGGTVIERYQWNRQGGSQVVGAIYVEATSTTFTYNYPMPYIIQLD